MCKICMEIGFGSPEDALAEQLEQAQARFAALEEELPLRFHLACFHTGAYSACDARTCEVLQEIIASLIEASP